MEDSQLEHRIRIFQYIQEAWRDSGSHRSLADILADHTFGMTRDELEDFLKDSIVPRLEQAWLDLEASRAREEERGKDLEREREARKKAEKAAADKDAEIEQLKKALADAMDTKATDNRNRFGSSSRKMRHSVDKDFNKDKSDRSEEKENHDGTATEGSSAATDSVCLTGEGGKVLTERELIARQQRQGTHYKLSDATEKVVYPCDVEAIPESWEVIEGADPVTRILFDTRKTIIARVVEFVKVRRLVKYTLEDGTEAEKWEYDSFHVPCGGKSLRRDVGIQGDPETKEDAPFDIRHIPGRIPGTSATPSFATEMLMDT